MGVLRLLIWGVVGRICFIRRRILEIIDGLGVRWEYVCQVARGGVCAVLYAVLDGLMLCAPRWYGWADGMSSWELSSL